MIYVINREGEISRPADDEITRAADSLLSLQDVHIPGGVIEILLCDHAVITDMNKEFRQEDSSTDVLAFEMLEEDPETSTLIVGSIAVNAELAAEKAKEHGKTMELDEDSSQRFADAEILLYILHGMLHFAGYDDDNPVDRRQMFDIAADVIGRLDYQVIPYDASQEV